MYCTGRTDRSEEAHRSPASHIRMATPAEMVTSIESALASSPAGTVEVQVDGQRVRWDRRQALDELEYWRRRNAIVTGRSIARTIDLSGGL